MCQRWIKGIRNKNLKKLNGDPLIYHTIKFAKNLNFTSTIALSTDSPEIKSYAEKIGLVTSYKRPKYLALDDSGKIDTINHLINYYEKEKT